jgi:large-conductance mechanosensitive channel
MEKRVEVKAIEFDWMLTSHNGEQFLERLRKTDNLGYFEIEVIKDLIMFQWGYFLPRIIIFLFIPFMLFFLMFVLYTTWVLDEMFNETDDNGTWHVAAFTLGI